MTSEPVGLNLSAAQFRTLGAMIKSPAPLSPFHGIDDGPYQTVPAELLSENGSMRPEWWRVVELLGLADSSGALTYTGPEGTVQVAVYSLAGNEPSVMVRNFGNDVSVASPPLVGEVVWLMREILGSSVVGIPNIEISLPVRETQTLLTVVDGGRRHEFRALAGDRPAGPTVAEQSELDPNPDRTDSATWLTSCFDRVAGVPPLSPADLEKGLGALAARGLVEVSGGQIVLGETATRFVGGLLIIEGHFRLRSALTGEDGITDVLDVHGLRGTSGAYLLWSISKGMVTFHSVSGLVLSQLIGRFLSSPQLMLATSMAHQPA